MQPRIVMAAAGLALAAAGCASQEQFKVQSVEQREAVQSLRVDAGRSESSIADLRSELRRTQASVSELQVTLADTRSKADAALTTSRDFLNSLVAAREEQRRQLAESGAAFTESRRKLAELDARLAAQQKALEQAGITLEEVSRRLVATEAGLTEATRRATVLEAGAKAGQQADAATTKQLQALRTQLDETRAVMSSESLLQLRRELQGVQKENAVLRGSLDDLHHAQAEAAARSRNQYLDLDSRIHAMKQKAQEVPAHVPSAAVEVAPVDHPVSQ